MNSSKVQSDSLLQAGAASVARQRNTAETAPRTVIRGEQKTSSNAQCQYLSPVFIDWLSFSWEETASWCPMESEIAALLGKWMGKHVHAQDNQRGGLGFRNSASFWVSTDGTTASKVATFYRGGDSQRGRVLLQIDGTGCGLIRDLSEVQCLIDSIDARITRVDLAVDDYSGQHINVESAVEWHREGKFSLTNKNPRVTCAGDWHDPEQGLGRTLYVGHRKNGKVCRIYEKGRQLGDKASPWTRFEVEIGSRDRIIPSTVLTDPAPFMAGQYPIAETLLQRVGKRIKTIKNEVAASLEKSVKHVITQCGALVNFLGKFLEFSDSEVVQLIKKEGHTPARLSKYAHMRVPDVAQFRADILRGFSAVGV